MALCCVCRRDATSDKKKKKLYNEACSEERKLLATFLQTSIAKELFELEETRGSDALLCYNCQSGLNQLEKARKTAQELEARLVALANNLHPVSASLARKRPPPSSASPSKAFRSQTEDVAAQFSGQSTEQSPPVAVS